ncbi:NAD(P)-binding domain-containing protein [Lacticaseibacillus paracasei]
MDKPQIGVVGMAVMGKNLALNIESRGNTVAIFNRTGSKTKAVVEEHPDKKLVPSYKIEDFVASLEKPRRIIMMVKAGAGTDAVIKELLPLLDKGDVLIDGGNTFFEDTMRRSAELDKSGINFIGMGVSGGELGALHGPSLMPGGQKEAYDLVAPILEGYISAMKQERVEASKVLPKPVANVSVDKKEAIEMIRKALYFSKLMSYAQGFEQLRFASEKYDWKLQYGDLAKIWRAGCIIRARFLQNITDAYNKKPDLQNLLLDDYFLNIAKNYQESVRDLVGVAVKAGVPVPGFSAAISYYDSYRSAVLPANLTQAQRDYFGAHTYERTDRDGIYHYSWYTEA